MVLLNRTLKKCIKAILGLYLVCITAISYGQEEATMSSSMGSSTGLKYGAKIGTNINQFNTSGMMLGVNLGGFVTYRVNDFIMAQGELLYSSMGGSRDDVVKDYSSFEGNVSSIRFHNRSVMLHCIYLPVMASFNLSSMGSETVVPRLLVGVSYAFNFGAIETHDQEIYFTDGTVGVAGYQRENVGAEFESHLFGLIGGVAVDFNYGDGRVFTMDVRYNQGMNDLNLFKSTYNGGAVYQSTLSINFGITL